MKAMWKRDIRSWISLMVGARRARAAPAPAAGPGRARIDDPRQQGAVGVEMALVLPFLVLMLTGIVDFGLIFFIHNNMVNAARDAARSVAVQEVTATQAEQVARDQLFFSGLTFTITITEPDPSDPTDNDVIVVITVPLAEASLADALGILSSGDLRTQVTMRKES